MSSGCSPSSEPTSTTELESDSARRTTFDRRCVSFPFAVFRSSSSNDLLTLDLLLPNLQAMQEIHKLRAQMSTIATSTLASTTTSKASSPPLFSPKLAPPNTTQLKILRQLITSAFIDQIAVRKDIIDPTSAVAGSKFKSTRGVAYRAMGVAEDVYIHPSSVMFHG